MRTLTKLTTILAALIATCCLFAPSACADPLYYNGLYYTVANDEVTIVGFSVGTAVEVPLAINGLPVRAIGNAAFRDQCQPTSIILPDSIRSIGAAAFCRCTNLTSISIGSGLTTIGAYAFDGCGKLTSVQLPADVTEIGAGAFRNCVSLTAINVPDGVTAIADNTFNGCGKLTSLRLPSGVGRIGANAFAGCSLLTSMTLPEGLTSLGAGSFSGCTALTNMSIPSGVTAVAANAFSGCTSLTNISIPSGVTAVAANAFSGCTALASVTLPGGLTALEDSAFQGCTSLKSVTIPGGIVGMGSSAFAGCTALTGVTVKAGLDTIGSHSFQGCYYLASVTFEGDVGGISDYAFEGCHALKSIRLPDRLGTIGSYAFSDTGLASVSIPASTTVGSYAFWGCFNLSGLTLNSGILTIGDYAFSRCTALKSVSIPSSLTTMGTDIFSHAGLTSVTLASGFTNIGRAMFMGCASLKSVSLPASLKRIGVSAFTDCPALKILQLPSGLETIANGAFSQCGALTTVALPATLTSLGNSAFSDCGSLATMDIPDGVVNLGTDVFSNCVNLEYVRLPSATKAIGKRLFNNCARLTGLAFPSGVESIGESAFYGCATMTDVQLPSGLLSIGAGAFSNCARLTGVRVPNGVTTIGANAFSYCTAMNKIYLPRSITSISSPLFDSSSPWIYVYGDSYAYSTLRVPYSARIRIIKIELSTASLRIKEGQSTQLASNVVHYDTLPVTWSSDHPEVATVDSSGRITAIFPGLATITASAADEPKLVVTCAVEVAPDYPCVRLSASAAALYPDESLTLTATVETESGVDPGVQWASDDEAVATVVDGVVSALMPGTALVTATSLDGSGRCAACVITVKRYAEGLILDRTDAAMYIGETLTLTPNVTPEDTSDKSVTWTSDDEAVATVSGGVVTAHKAGTTKITATTADGSRISAACDIQVFVPVSSLTLDKAEGLLRTGGTLLLAADVAPVDAHDRSLIWQSSDAGIARVDGGLVTGVARGTAIITATAHNGIAARCTITVEDRVVDLTLHVPEGTPSTGGGYDLGIGATLQIGATVLPDGIGGSLTFASSDKRLATVSATGLVKGVKAGNVTVTVTARDAQGLGSQTRTLKLNVISPVTGVSLPAEVAMLTGTAKKLAAACTPSGATYKALTFGASDESVATVKQDGTVSARTPGIATITATAHNGKSASCLVRVTDATLSILVTSDGGKATLDYKQYLQLSAEVSPKTAAQSVTWKSSNTAYATVDKNGRVYGKKVGKATITVTATDGTKVYGRLDIRVITPVATVNLPESERVFVGKSKKLQSTISPTSATFKTLTWESSDPHTATVAQDGTVTAIKPGSVAIKATAHNGTFDQCVLSVTRPVTRLTLSVEGGISPIYKGEKVRLTCAAEPADADEQGVVWKSSNTRYATVDAQGVLTAKAAGKVRITATAVDGSGIYATMDLTIATPEKSITLNKASATIYLNGDTDALRSTQLTAKASPNGTQYRGLSFAVLNGDAATVDAASGLVTGLKEGDVVIRATTEKGSHADCAIAVRTLPTNLSLGVTQKALAFKQSFDLGAAVVMDGSEWRLTWTSSNGKVATVTSAGQVKASSSRTGTAIITAKSVNGIAATCEITVERGLPQGGAAAIAAPSVGLTLMGGGYTSEDPDVADVGSNGRVKLKRDGSAVLWAAGTQIVIRVEAGCLSGLTLDEGVSVSLDSGDAIRWSSSDERVASVDQNGRLVALGAGDVVIKGEAQEGGIVEIRVTVRLAAPQAPEPSAQPEPTVPQAPEPSTQPEPTAQQALDPSAQLEPIVPQAPKSSVPPEPIASQAPEPSA